MFSVQNLRKNIFHSPMILLFLVYCCFLSLITTNCIQSSMRFMNANYIYPYYRKGIVNKSNNNLFHTIGFGTKTALRIIGGIDSTLKTHKNNVNGTTYTAINNTTNLIIDGWRKPLSLQLQNRKGALQYIRIPVGMTSRNNSLITCQVYLLGTAHISRESCVDSRQLLELVQPDCLFMELCHQRLDMIEDKLGNMENNRSKNDAKRKDQANNLGISRTAAFGSMLLSKIQGDYANKLNVSIGGEFKEAFTVALEQQIKFNNDHFDFLPHTCNTKNLNESYKVRNGCSVILGDRPVFLTLTRAWESLKCFGKVKLILGLLWSLMRQPNEEELNDWIESILNDPTNDILSESIKELSYHFPSIYTTIISERDKYMASKLLQTVRMLGYASINDKRERKIVAVVGAGHILGIMKELNGYCEQWYNSKISHEEQDLMLENIIGSLIETKKLKVNNNENIQSLKSELIGIDMRSLSEKLSFRYSSEIS